MSAGKPVRFAQAETSKASGRALPNWETLRPDFGAYVMAVQRVEELLRRVTTALEQAGISHAIVGGNAVAAWVSAIDPDAVRATKDVDLLVRRADLDQIADVLRPIGLIPAEVLGVSMFVDAKDPSPRTGVHLLFANEPVRADDLCPAPDVEKSRRGVLGYRVIELPELVGMKLVAFRLRDQTHLVDMLSAGLIDASWKAQVPPELQDRFQQVLEAFEREEGRG